MHAEVVGIHTVETRVKFTEVDETGKVLTEKELIFSLPEELENEYGPAEEWTKDNAYDECK